MGTILGADDDDEYLKSLANDPNLDRYVDAVCSDDHFGLLDSDGDGFLTRSEFMTLDTNCDGVVSMDEFRAMSPALGKQPGAGRDREVLGSVPELSRGAASRDLPAAVPPKSTPTHRRGTPELRELIGDLRDPELP